MSVTTSGLQSNVRRRAAKNAVELLSSMRFAIALLVVLAIASIIGTVLTQGDPYPNYVNQFGPFWADIFRSLGLYTVYGSWWFMLILGFLMVSVLLCVIRHAPKIVADVRSWKDRVREGSLRAFHHRGEFVAAAAPAQTADVLAKLAARLGYRFVVRETDGGVLIAAKRGALARLGYIFTHLAVVVICLGSLVDSNLPVKLQMWLFDKTPITDNASISSIAPQHRLPVSNPTFRGYAWVPEGQSVSTAILNEPDGSLVQDLPFSIQLKRFIVDYYSTGMPRLFASDIVVIDHRTGARIPARVEVNKPFEYDGVSIYQSSFQDGGSQMRMTLWPMTGARATGSPFGGTIGSAVPLSPGVPGADGQSVEFVDFRPINVEDLSSDDGATGAAHRPHESFEAALDARLGSGAKSEHPLDLRNVGPSVQYKVRDKDGQAREYNNYMLPIDVDGASMFLAGVRENPGDAFRYLRIPADSAGTPADWMRLRAAFEDPALRAEAAHRFAIRSVSEANPDLRLHLEESALRVMTLFAGADSGAAARTPGGLPAGGFQAIAAFIDQSVPKDQQETAANLLMRMLEGATWDLWQLAREQAGEPDTTANAQAARFVQDSINAVSDSFLYGAPVYLQLDGFRQVQASVFQLTRAPGRKVVYLGSLLLVLGILSMFYVRERRLWFRVKGSDSGTNVLMAMSTARRTLDFENEFVRTREAVGKALGAAPVDAGAPDAATVPRAGSTQDTDR
ncbi:cytochrome C biogenesis protein ResB [Burkholderia sp. WAC0059]|uniref:cytochrome c biogenesis protein ResB n=1 Tax=Burkholderia sp. WAC0059 TaxID=2066022 RepID=UPI000C7EF1DD|nr:cytochrome c biogenesis protein ResB [Burkholderia sp. WAC0059]PLZ01335.1 cytochrome C biogenesis protein ResB [Burkholderia sp. WAC0059]